MHPKRFLRLLLRLLLITPLLLVPLTFYVYIKRYFLLPKAFTFRFFAFTATLVWIALGPRKNNRSNPLLLPLIVLLFAGLVSTLAAVNTAEALDVLGLPDWTLWVLFIAVVSQEAGRDRALIRIGMRCLVFSIAVLCLFDALHYIRGPHLKLLGFFLPMHEGPGNWLTALGGCSHGGTFLGVLIPFLLVSGMSCPHRRDRTLAVLGVVLLSGQLGRVFRPSVECGILAASVAAICLAPSVAGIARRTLLMRLILVVIVPLMGVRITKASLSKEGWGSLLNETAAIAEEYSVDRMLETWGSRTIVFRRENIRNSAVQIVHDLHNPPYVLGLGVGNYKIVHPLFVTRLERQVLGMEVLARKAHSAYLGIAAEFGPMGVFALLWFFGVVLGLVRRKTRWRDRTLPARGKPMDFYGGHLFAGFTAVLSFFVMGIMSATFHHIEAYPITAWAIGLMGASMMDRPRVPSVS